MTDLQKAASRAKRGNYPMAAVAALPDWLFVQIYNQTENYLYAKNGVWALKTGSGEEWKLPQPKEALRITHIGENPHKRVLKKYTGSTNPLGTVVDVGAYIGEFTRWASSGIAIEPDWKNAACCKRNTPETVEVVSMAAWDETAEIPFERASDPTEGSVVGVDDGSEPISNETIPCVRIDDLVENSRYEPEEIDLIKIEAEGAEYEVVKGAVSLQRPMSIDCSAERDGESPRGPIKSLLSSENFVTVWDADKEVLHASPQPDGLVTS